MRIVCEVCGHARVLTDQEAEAWRAYLESEGDEVPEIDEDLDGRCGIHMTDGDPDFVRINSLKN